MTAGGVRLYRAALHGYPRRFREEYGPDMVALLEDQLRDEHPVRVWARALADLAITVPTRHLEAHMNRPPSFVVPALFAGLSAAGVLIVVIGGAGGATLTAGSLVTVVAGLLSYLAWRDVRRLGGGSASDRWWKFLGAGLAVFGLFLVVTSGDISERVWALMMVTLVLALALMSTGAILAIDHLVRRRRQAQGPVLP